MDRVGADAAGLEEPNDSWHVDARLALHLACRLQGQLAVESEGVRGGQRGLERRLSRGYNFAV